MKKIIILPLIAAVVSLAGIYSGKNKLPVRFDLKIPLSSALFAAEDDWAFVSQSATWARGNSLVIDSIITPLQNSGALSYAGATFTQENITAGEGSFTIKLTNVDTVVPGASVESFTVDKTFSHKFEMWTSGDNIKVMELYFDNPDALNITNDGALLLYRLSAFSSALAYEPEIIIESYSFIDATGNTNQVYSWSGGGGASIINGRVVLEEMTLNGDPVVCFQSVVSFNGSILNDVCATTPLNASAAGQTYYYSLAYSVKQALPNESTAVFGFNNTLDDTAVVNNITNAVCGNNTYVAYSKNFGLFKDTGFIQDSVAILDVPTEYPDPTAVVNLFAKNGTAPDGAGEYNDLTKTTIDGLTTTFLDPTSLP